MNNIPVSMVGCGELPQLDLLAGTRVTLLRSVASGIQEKQRKTHKLAEGGKEASFVIMQLSAH